MTSVRPSYPQSAAAVRAAIRAERRTKGLLLPLGIFAADYAVFVATFVGIAASPNWFVKAALAVVNAHLIAALFIVGHDACHNSLTRSGALNRLLRRLAFLPSLTPYTTWRYTHNYLHHSFTNCKDRDFVWRPLSLAEYRALPWHRRWLERHYRTLAGLPLNWIIENWLAWHLFPGRAVLAEMKKWGTPTADRLLVAGWLVFASSAVGGLTWLFDRPETFAEASAAFAVNAASCLVAPFFVWSALISYVDLLHHTHPAIRWYADSREPAFSDVHLEGTTQVRYPFPLGLLYHHIMEHTAHHVDPTVPLYHLDKAQRDLASEHPGRIVVEFFSLRYVLRVLRVCKLYDYAAHRWVGYDGEPTTPDDVDQRGQ